jgi:hypothetical protein
MLAALTACAGANRGKPPEATGTPVKTLRNFAAYDDAFKQEGMQWVRSQQQLNATGSTLLTDLRIDWDRESVIIVAMGTKPTGGYGVVITNVLLDKNKSLNVIASVREPGQGEAVRQALEHPIAVAVIEYTAPDATAYLHTRPAGVRPAQ